MCVCEREGERGRERETERERERERAGERERESNPFLTVFNFLTETSRQSDMTQEGSVKTQGILTEVEGSVLLCSRLRSAAFHIKTIFSFFTKQTILTRRSIVLRISSSVSIP